MASSTICVLVNQRAPVPSIEHRRREWLLAGQQLRFPGGLCMDVQIDPSAGIYAMNLRWHRAGSTHAMLTGYEPVSLASDCGMRVVLRAIAMRDDVPIAVLVEVEGIAEPPRYRIGLAA